MDFTDIQESQDDTTFSTGYQWLTPWRCYLVSLDGTGTNNFDFYNGLGGVIAITNGGSPSYRGQMTCTVTGGTPTISYSDGSQDVFGLAYMDSANALRFYVSQRVDAYGNTTTYNYNTNLYSGLVCLTSITDVDGKSTTLSYTNVSGFALVTNVADPFGRNVQLKYDSAEYPHLTNITDVMGISSSFQYAPSDDVSRLITPYATNCFLGLSPTDGSTNKALWLQQIGVQGTIRNELYLYSDDVSTNLLTNSFLAWCPSTTNGSVFAFANTFDTNDSNRRDSFYWNPVQFNLLPTSFLNDLTNNQLLNMSELQATNLLDARLCHWLINAIDQNGDPVPGCTLSLQRDPSPDGVALGEIT